MNEIARYLAKRMVAEFVENEEVVPVLRSIGVDYGQGYFFCRPRPAQEVLLEL